MAFESEGNDEIFELKGNLGLTEIGQGLMHSVIEGSQTDDGKLVKEAVNQGFGGFVPNILYEHLVKNYSLAEKLYGKTIINLMSGYDADFVGKNVKIPEFQRELKKRLDDKLTELQDSGLVNKDNQLTEKALQLASLVTYVEELDTLDAKGLFGEQVTKKLAQYGSRSNPRNFRKGDRYRDIALRDSVKRASRRNHSKLNVSDLSTFERLRHGKISIIYAIDASGSMKGQKIDLAKKAGVALSFKAIERSDKVGLVVFSKEVRNEIAPTSDFGILLRTITRIRAARETDMVSTIRRAMEIFPKSSDTKHLLLITDALPTIGKNPASETFEAAQAASSNNITISVVGINLDKKGRALAERVALQGKGRFYLVENPKELDQIILHDYYSLI